MENLKENHTPEVLTLRDRVKSGNQKLNDAWEQLKRIVHDKERWAEEMERWHKSNEKLSLLCTQLEVMGYTDCLYIENGKKRKKCLPPGDDIGCRVCPSSIRYWEKELMDLPSPSNKP